MLLVRGMKTIFVGRYVTLIIAMFDFKTVPKTCLEESSLLF